MMSWKSYHIIFILLFSINFSATSQNRDFIVGTMIGFYGIHIEGETNEMYSPSNGSIGGTGGLSFGINVKRSFSENIYGAFELRSIRKGSIYEFSTNYATKAFEIIKLDYIEVPVLLGFKINLMKKPLFFETGLAYARLINSKMLVSELNDWNPSSKLNDFKDADISWVVNLKYPIIKSNKLLLGFRFSYSLLSTHSVYKLYNMDYGIELYYLFNKNVK